MNQHTTPDSTEVEILIAEDSPTQAEQLRLMLEQHGYRTTVAQNGREALELLARRRPTLIISDVMMPEMGGYDLCKAVKSDDQLKDIPLMLLTALSDSNAVLKGLECGADNFFTKPYDEQYLLSRIRHIVANRGLPSAEEAQQGVGIVFEGERYFITAERRQILGLLLSTYETAVRKNTELVNTQDALRELNDTLEQKVLDRTAELAHAQESLRQANRALRAISLCNEKLVRAVDEETLLNDICRTITEAAGYRMAWVGYAEREGVGKLRPMAGAGYDAGYLEALDFACEVAGKLCVPAATAIRTGAPVAIPDIAAEPENNWRDEALKRGYRSALALPLRVDSEVIGALSIDAAEPHAFSEEEVRLLSELASDLSFGIAAIRTEGERARLEHAQEEGQRRLRQALLGTIQTMSRTIEQRDPYTAGHQERVARLAGAIAEEIGLPPEQVEGVRIGGMIHDIGKIHVPAEILTRPAVLSAIEFEIVKTHAQTGADIVKGVEFPWPVAEMIVQHHERLDGSGYPNGLTADTIMLEAKILSVADVVEAMATHRPYRPGIGLDAALAEIEKNRGRLYEPTVVDACLTLFRDKGFTFVTEPKSGPTVGHALD